MTNGEAYSAFYTLLLGLGVAAMLTGLADVMRRKALREIGVNGWLLLVLILFEFLTGWVSSAGAMTLDEGAWAGALLLPFLTGACYFLVAVLLFPDAERRAGGGMSDYIANQTRTIALLLLAANTFLLTAEADHFRDQFANNAVRFWTFLLPYNAAILIAYAAIAGWPRRRIATIAMAALALVYIAAMLFRP